MIRFLRHYIVPAGLIFCGLFGLWAAWVIIGLHVVYASVPLGIIAAVIGGSAALYMLILAAFLLIKRRGFLTINPFAILAAYLSIPAAMFLVAAVIAFYIIRTSVNTLTF